MIFQKTGSHLWDKDFFEKSDTDIMVRLNRTSLNQYTRSETVDNCSTQNVYLESTLPSF